MTRLAALEAVAAAARALLRGPSPLWDTPRLVERLRDALRALDELEASAAGWNAPCPRCGRTDGHPEHCEVSGCPNPARTDGRCFVHDGGKAP